MEADTPGLSTDPSQKNSNKSPDEQIQDALESILSKKNLVRDQFLASKMNPQMYIPISVLLVHHRLQALDATHDQVVSAATKSKRLGVDDQKTMVRPIFKSKRNVVILRDLPEGTTEEEIMELLASGPYAESVVSVKPEVNNTWFVKFNVDDGAQEVVLWLRSQSFKGKPLNAAIKSEHFLRSFFPVNANLGFVPPGLPPLEQDMSGMPNGGIPEMLPGFPGAGQFGGKGMGGFCGHDLMGPPPGMGHPIGGMMMPPDVPLMEPQFSLQGPGFWKAWGTRFRRPPLVLPANGVEVTVPGSPEVRQDAAWEWGKGKGKGKEEHGYSKGKAKSGKGHVKGTGKWSDEYVEELPQGSNAGKGSKAPRPPPPSSWQDEPLPWQAAGRSAPPAQDPAHAGADDEGRRKAGADGKAPKMKWAVKSQA